MSIFPEKVKKQDSIVFADKELEYRMKAAILLEDSNVYYCFGAFEPYGWVLPRTKDVPDIISYEDAAKIKSIVFCDNPSSNEAKDTIADLRKLSRLKSLNSIEFWEHRNAFIFKVRLQFALPKVRIVGLGDMCIKESLMLKLPMSFKIRLARLQSALPQVKKR